MAAPQSRCVEWRFHRVGPGASGQSMDSCHNKRWPGKKLDSDLDQKTVFKKRICFFPI